MNVTREIRVHAADPDFRVGNCPLKFTLTFEGGLQTGGAKAERKHARRRFFHLQLKRLWQTNPLLSDWHIKAGPHQQVRAQDHLIQQLGQFHGFRFVPLITRDLCVEAALHFHILRPSDFKGQIADPDNIIKILVDSLKMPQATGEMPSGAMLGDDEDPFFVLMQDDGLVSKITSVSEELLQPIDGKDKIERSDTRVIIEVYIRPNYPKDNNLIFFSDNFEIWNNLWASEFDGIRNWSNAELKARATQCILRMRVTAQNFQMQRQAIHTSQMQTWGSEQNDNQTHVFWKNAVESQDQYAQQCRIWVGGLRPFALAITEELRRRIYGEPPYPETYKMIAINEAVLAGANPIENAADGIESLIGQLG